MKTYDILQVAIDVAEMNGDNLVVACLCVVKAHYITGEINDLTEILVDVAKKKLSQMDTEMFPMEIPYAN